MLESEFQPELKRQLTHRFPGCVIIKQDANMLQGVPDLLVLWGTHWAMLETKRGFREKKQVNQPYWVERFNGMSFSAFVRPQNYVEILDEMERLWLT